MGGHGICGIHKRRKPRWRGSGSGFCPAPADLARRNFRSAALNRTWAGDIACFSIAEGWLRLAVVLDAGSKQAVRLLHSRSHPRPTRRLNKEI